MTMAGTLRTVLAKCKGIKGPSTKHLVRAISSSFRPSRQHESLCPAGAASRRLEPSEADSMMDIGIRGIFNQEHDTFRRKVRKFVQEELVPHERVWETQGYPDRQVFEQASKAGVYGVSCPVEYNGPGGSIKDQSIVWDELCYGNCSVSASFLLTNEIVMPYIYEYGSTEQKNNYISRVVNDGLVASIAMTEPGTGSDLQGITTWAKQDGDDWIINGSKMFITNGFNCHVCVVVAKTSLDSSRAAHGISLFFVDEDTPGFVKGSPLKKLGMHGSDTTPLYFDEVRVPKGALLGEVNKGFHYLMNMLPTERLVVAGMHIGTAEYMFEQTRSHLKERNAAGSSAAGSQAVLHKMAEMKTDICTSRAFMDQCLESYFQKTLTGHTASMAKYWVTDMVNNVGRECIQVHGEAGFLEETEVARAYASARAGAIYGGANEVMKELISRQIVHG